MVRFLAGKDTFLFLPSVHGDSGTTLASYSVGTGGSSPGLKRLGRETDHLLQSIAEVKSDGSCTFTPSLCHCGMLSYLLKHGILIQEFN